MRRIMLTVALVLWASQIEAAVLFPPDSFRLDVTAVFNDTNTNTFCWQCGDSNPLNDFQAVLQSFPDLTDAWTDFLPYAGSIHLQGTATDYLGLDANFSLRVRFTAWGASLPESLVHPSVSDGIIPGRILGGRRRSRNAVLECCDGTVGGVQFRQAFFPSFPFTVPPEGLHRAGRRRSFTFQNKSNTPPSPNRRRCSCSDPRSRRPR